MYCHLEKKKDWLKNNQNCGSSFLKIVFLGKLPAHQMTSKWPCWHKSQECPLCISLLGWRANIFVQFALRLVFSKILQFFIFPLATKVLNFNLFLNLNIKFPEVTFVWTVTENIYKNVTENILIIIITVWGAAFRKSNFRKSCKCTVWPWSIKNKRTPDMCTTYPEVQDFHMFLYTISYFRFAFCLHLPVGHNVKFF